MAVLGVTLVPSQAVRAQEYPPRRLAAAPTSVSVPTDPGSVVSAGGVAVVNPQVAGVQVLNTPTIPSAVSARPSAAVLGASLDRPVAFTGADSQTLVIAGTTFTAAGVVLLMSARRRTHRRRPFSIQ